MTIFVAGVNCRHAVSVKIQNTGDPGVRAEVVALIEYVLKFPRDSAGREAAFMNLNQVTAPSTNVRRSIDFYRSLGLVLIVENLPSYARFECPEGDATFSVHQTNQPPGSPGVVVYFECEDLDSTVARPKEGGLRFESESQDQPWLWREAFLQDPDGNVICLFRAGENRKNPPWRLRRT